MQPSNCVDNCARAVSNVIVSRRTRDNIKLSLNYRLLDLHSERILLSGISLVIAIVIFFRSNSQLELSKEKIIFT
jgi:hypothetical protein